MKPKVKKTRSSITPGRAQNRPNLKIVTETTEFFKEKVSDALEKQKVKTTQDTEFYLVELLSKFMLTDNLFSADETGAHKQEVLALLLKAALTTPDATKKKRDLRRLGDVSLYTAGYFSDSLARKVVDVDYYIGMGKTAYGSLAQAQLDQLKKVFAELSERFHKFVDVLAEIRHTTTASDSQSILRLYEVWLKTKSEFAEKSLKQAGIIPNPLVKKNKQ